MVPTSFIVLPFNITDQRDEASHVKPQKVKGLFGKLKAAGSKVKSKFPKATWLDLTQGQTKYFYLLDEVTRTVVAVDPKGVYPIEIESKSDKYVHFMTTHLPLLRTSLGYLKMANSAAGFLTLLGVPSLSVETISAMEDFLDFKASSVADFDIVQLAVEDGNGRSVSQVRGAAMRELERFFEENDPDRHLLD
ncbi:Aste57867_10807 [Aphanomyces stellatus]|uniref:Aste57867_10807 protein n=1 Tax=Aphanomyces stellatus TaxID=120398 RepID=A0A485KRA5_9STRA|nr:hypothetical protein As57867_010767 [Aphanomyces stellatus]VFT87676.1 Aste57867_10807 [Aphanomyces stellatus]